MIARLFRPTAADLGAANRRRLAAEHTQAWSVIEDQPHSPAGFPIHPIDYHLGRGLANVYGLTD